MAIYKTLFGFAHYLWRDIIPGPGKYFGVYVVSYFVPEWVFLAYLIIQGRAGKGVKHEFGGRLMTVSITNRRNWTGVKRLLKYYQKIYILLEQPVPERPGIIGSNTNTEWDTLLSPGRKK